MQINNQTVTSQKVTHEKPLDLKQGEIYQATIKERSFDNKALVQIRGREIQVKFEGEVPSQDRVTVQITGKINQEIQVKAISDGPKATSAPQTEVARNNQTLHSLGISSPSQELRQAVQIVLEKGVPLTHESVQDLRNFIENEKGTVEQRINTVQAVANKRLEITANHLRSVHEALNGQPLNEILTNIVEQIDGNYKITSENMETVVNEKAREVRDQIQREPNNQRSLEQIRTEVINYLRGDQLVASQGERLATAAQIMEQNAVEAGAKNQIDPALRASEAIVRNQETLLGKEEKLDQKLNLSELLKQMQATVQKEGDLLKAITLLTNQLERASFGQPIIEQVQGAIDEAVKLQEDGRELGARKQLLEGIAAIEGQVAKLTTVIQSEAQQYMMNEAFQTQKLSSKDLIVRIVTEKLAKAQNEFKILQRDITRNLDNIQRLTELFKNQAVNQVKPLLETTIKKLDNTILKSEMMLLTDMKTEKRLMQASSQLAEAKKLLSRGNFQEANKIVQEIKNLIEKLEFKPSETQVKHFVSKEELNGTNRTGSQQLLQQFDEITRRTAMQEPSARQVFELVRSLGLNRDSEIAQLLASGGKQSDGETNPNMKQALMQLMQMEEEQGCVSQQTNQALANITGQQLLSKADNSNLQSMFFSLPFLLRDEVKNLQVFVNSRNEGHQVDWENCNLYFLIETKKLGEVGILVTATDRKLSLTIKNDQPLFKERMIPLAEKCKEKLEDVGYNIASLTFTKLHQIDNKTTNNHKPEEQSQKMTPTFTEKGFDFKI